MTVLPQKLASVWLLAARIALLCMAVTLAACASTSIDATQALNPDPPSKMFADGDALMARGKFEDAAAKFEELDREHPYSPEARRAIVMSAYAYYRAGKTPEAIASAERYVALHPGTKEAPLAHHIIASSYFDDIRGPNRDQTATRKALEQLKGGLGVGDIHLGGNGGRGLIGGLDTRILLLLTGRKDQSNRQNENSSRDPGY